METRPAVGITEGGWGEVRIFASPPEARDDDDVDVVVRCDVELVDHYLPHELETMMRRLGAEHLAQLAGVAASVGGTERRRIRAVIGDLPAMWEYLLKCAGRRILTKKETSEMAEKRTAASKKGAAPKATKPPAGEKKPAMGRGRYKDEQRITLGRDKDSKPYGADNNPLRAGSAAHGRFARIQSGMTVGDYKKIAGKHVGSDLKFNTSKGYVTVA